MRNTIKPYYPNLLLVSGAGRNVGKTTFIIEVIQKFSTQYKTAGIKISPHFHQANFNVPVYSDAGLYNVFGEENKNNVKDSSRMKRAGADPVFYIESKEPYIGHAFDLVMRKMPAGVLVIAESGGLHHFVDPGLFFYIRTSENSSKLKPGSAIEVYRDENYFEKTINRINIDKKQWNYFSDENI